MPDIKPVPLICRITVAKGLNVPQIHKLKLNYLSNSLYLSNDRAIRESFYAILKPLGDAIYLLHNIPFPAKG